ncbi:MAG: hypothetical protein KA586_05270 [Candidatus Promineofilum sp.]|nr:hypothetical protein [Promineifilum sp.]
MKTTTLFLLCGLILLAGCSAAESLEPTAAAATVVAPATAASDAGPLSEVIYGRNDDGTFFHGAPDAPVTFIDYSDFL